MEPKKHDSPLTKSQSGNAKERTSLQHLHHGKKHDNPKYTATPRYKTTNNVMSDVTELKLWPSGVDAVDWSHDGIIAFASDETVELLFPNIEAYNPEQEDTSWQRVSLQISWFTKNELPDKEPAPVPTYSIGEEISASLPVKIAWSPPGLAKHRRCALGALTSNLVLSIWSADGRPQEEASWERRLIINDALAEYFANKSTQEESHVVSETVEKMRLRTRIREFVWAPALPNRQPSNIIGTQVDWGQHLIAAANDDNHVVFMLVDSPTSTYGKDENWSAEVLNHFSLALDSESFISNPFTFDDILQQQRYVSCLAWSPWTVQGDWYHSVLVYATNDDVRARIITYTHDTIGLGDEVIYGDLDIRQKGPMKWSPYIADGDKFTLALFTNSGITCLTISSIDAAILRQTSHDLDSRWDEISGVAWDYTLEADPRLHVSSLSTTLVYPTAVLKLSGSELSADPSPYWREHIKDAHTLFSAQNELKGNVRSRVWGLTTSPLGDFTATPNSYHPTDMIEYGPPSDRRSTLAVNRLRSYAQMPLSFPPGNASAEGILFTLRKWLDHSIEDTEQMSQFSDDALRKLVEHYGIIQNQGDTAQQQNDLADIRQVLKSFKRIAFLNPHTLKDRYSILVSQVCSTTPSNDLERTLIAYRLAKAVTKLPPELANSTRFSAEIFAAHQQVVTLIQYLLDDNDNAEDSSQAPALGDVGTDMCDICGAEVPFADLTSACCTNGHEFPRCGLSFIAIQAPRITKYCGICKAPFLGEDFVMAQESESRIPSRQMEITLEVDRPSATEAESQELPVSLARVLFQTCDACVYCGGKFVG